jgi:hypothetical protein
MGELGRDPCGECVGANQIPPEGCLRASFGFGGRLARNPG